VELESATGKKAEVTAIPITLKATNQPERKTTASKAAAEPKKEQKPAVDK
jgi:hypothetical protein